MSDIGRGATAAEGSEDLLERARAGDREAWGAIIDRHQGVVRAILDRYQLDQEAKVDAYQAVWLKLVENLGRIRDPERLAGWLATVARHEAVARVRLALSVETAATLDEASKLPSDTLESRERTLVRQALERLDPMCQELLTRLLFEDPAPSYDSLSGVLGIPRGSLGPTRSRCLSRLWQMMQTLDPDLIEAVGISDSSV